MWENAFGVEKCLDVLDKQNDYQTITSPAFYKSLLKAAKHNQYVNSFVKTTTFYMTFDIHVFTHAETMGLASSAENTK